MAELKSDEKPRTSGWYSVRFKSNLSKKELDEKKLASTFIDWVFFDGSKWDASPYDTLGFYVSSVIKAEQQ